MSRNAGVSAPVVEAVIVEGVSVQVISAARPEWIYPFTGLQPALSPNSEDWIWIWPNFRMLLVILEGQSSAKAWKSSCRRLRGRGRWSGRC
jgi:hypothetical protein